MVFSGQTPATVRRKHTSLSHRQSLTYSILWWQAPEGSRDFQGSDASSKLCQAQEEAARTLPETAHSAFPWLLYSVAGSWVLSLLVFHSPA